MGSFKVVLLFLFFKCVVSDEHVALVNPCDVQDMECLRRSTEMFMERTSAGIPENNILQIEPVFLPMTRVLVNGGDDLMLHYHNATLFGLKNMKIENFKLDSTAKSVVFSTKEDFKIDCNLVVVLPKKSKTFQGAWEAKGSSICTVNYNYEIKKDEKGVEHFKIGPETIHCEVPEEPRITLSEDLQNSLNSDPDVASMKDEYLAHQSQVRKQAVRKMMEEAFRKVVHNIRTSAKLLPRNAFFTNV